MPRTNLLTATQFSLVYCLGHHTHTRVCTIEKIPYYMGVYKDLDSIVTVLLDNILYKTWDKRRTLHATIESGKFDKVVDTKRLVLAKEFIEKQGWIVLPV